MMGEVLGYSDARCYGWIRGDDGREYFVHRRDFKGAPLMTGERVEFTPLSMQRGLRAARVSRASLTRQERRDGSVGFQEQPSA